MKHLFLSTLLVLLLECSAARCSEPPSERRAAAEKGFLERWHNFQGDGRQFPLWTPSWTEEELRARYDQMQSERLSVYFTNAEECRTKKAFGLFRESFKTPENWKTCGSHYPYPLAFAYNLASPSYNASIITLHGKQFLAMEGPTKESLDNFLELLTQYRVTDLVRVTAAVSLNRENSVPYWEGHINVHPKTGRPTIMLTGREINYFCTDFWENHLAFEPKRLIALVRAVMENSGPDQLIAVHCRAGIGRTGTFLAAYTLIADINQQIARGVPLDHIQVSIDRVVWEESLERPFVVNNFEQYKELYEVVSVYMDMLKTGS
jgi:hypothetical protein